jgi:cyclohexyl-isocyanide hydratase
MASRGSLSTEARLSTPFVVAITASGTWVNRREKCFVGTSRLLFSVCTGALLCGAAGGLVGRQVTTHRSARHLMRYYGAVLVDARVAVDDNIISAAGATAGLDAALALVSLLRGDAAAQEIQLAIEYAPNPTFHSGTPENAPAEVLERFQKKYESIGRDTRVVWRHA